MKTYVKRVEKDQVRYEQMVYLEYYNGIDWIPVDIGPFENERSAWISLGNDTENYRTIRKESGQMGWSIGYDTNWKRDIGYGVPAKCDHPRCDDLYTLQQLCPSQLPMWEGEIPHTDTSEG